MNAIEVKDLKKKLGHQSDRIIEIGEENRLLRKAIINHDASRNALLGEIDRLKAVIAGGSE